MELGIILVCMVLVLAVKGLTSLSLGKLQKAVKDAEAEEAELLKKLTPLEASENQKEREASSLEREEKKLVEEKDTLFEKIRALGGLPHPEEEIDARQAAKEAEEAVEVDAELQEESESIDSDPEEVAEEIDLPDSLQTFRILVVDDNTDLRNILEQALIQEYAVVGAVDGLEALTKVLKEKQVFDLVITDLKMPNVNGITLLEHLPKDVPTIVVSGFLDTPAFQDALTRFEPAAVLRKPFGLTEIREAIEEVVAQGQANLNNPC